MNKEHAGNCKLCERYATTLSEHHLIPRETHTTKRVQKRFTREQMNTTADFCHPCHKAAHAFFTNKTLALERYTVALLRAHEGINNHIEWVRKQQPGFKSRGGSKRWGGRR